MRGGLTPAPLCELCGILPSLCVCQACGRRVCRRCFIPEDQVCEGCLPRAEKDVAKQPVASAAWRWVQVGPALTFAGLGLMLIGVLIIFLATLVVGGNISGGIVIFIGPFPIALGYGPEALPLLVVAFLITAVIVLALLLWVRPSRPHRPTAQP